MIGFSVAVLLLALALLALALQRTYSLLTPKELKRRARAKNPKDPVAEMLYRAVAYGASLKLLLWIIIVLAAAGSFVLLTEVAPNYLAFITVAVTLSYGFVWMPAHHATRLGTRVAVWLTPAVAWLLSKLYPLLNKLAVFIQRHRPVVVHTGLYDREDLLKLVEMQKGQPDSRISPDTLDLLSHALTFGDKLVRDIMVPGRAVRQVSVAEPVGPVLIKELHDSGFSRFPVYDSAPGDIVATLFLRDLIDLKHTGQIRDIMQPGLNFVHEDYPLEQVLDAFLKTQHHLFLVVNSFEEFVGIITIEDILEQIIGAKIVDEFDQYDDVRAVAAHKAKGEHAARHKKGQETVVVEADSTNPYETGSLKHLLYGTGFRGNALEIAFGVALGESGGKAKAHNDNADTGDDSYGLFQINMLGAMGPERRKLYGLKDDTDLFDPIINARVAFELSGGGKDWEPWSVYNSGAYKKYYDPKSDAKVLL